MKNSIALKMLKSTLWMMMVFGAVSCSKDSDSLDANNQLPEEILTAQGALKSQSAKQTASPITPWATPGAVTQWDDNPGILRTALWFPPAVGPTFPDYSFTQYPSYDFSPYYVNGETEYNQDNYDLMAHFGYISDVAYTNAIVEFTFPNIEYFLPHMNAADQQRIYTVNYAGNQTVITCITNLNVGMNPMFCFLLKIDCNGNNNTTFWTEMKVNGVSKKGTIKNKVFDCNKVTTAHFGTYDTAFDLWCGNKIMDHISGTMNYHCVMQYENDVLLFMNMTYNGFLTSDNTGEVFKYKEITTFDLSKSDMNSNFHFNVKGDKGSHFIVFGKYLNEDPWIIIDKAKCSE